MNNVSINKEVNVGRTKNGKEDEKEEGLKKVGWKDRS